jgi:hypothetical protein
MAKKIDYKSFNGEPNTEEQGFNRRWWTAQNLDELCQGIAGVLKTINDFDGKRQTQYQTSIRLYGNADIMGINGLSVSKVAGNQNTLKDRISYNVVQSTIDTITAKIAKNKPKPLFLTSGGDYKMQRKAKKLTKFVDGVFYQNKIGELASMAFKDACIFADGMVHVYAEDGQVKYERVLPSEIFVDFLDGQHGDPRQMHRVKDIDRDVLLDMFPSHKKAILECNAVSDLIIAGHQHITDRITVAESWHLPSGKDASDGLHVISINNQVLFKEKYEKSFFPFAKMTWSRRPRGYWGMSLAESIQNIQLEINKLLWVIQRSMHLAGSFKIFVENSSKIVKEHLSNDLGSIIAYSGQQPTYLVPPIVPPEVYQHLQTLKNAAYEQAGISQLSASSQKPAGLNSGKALREYNDIETERFMMVGQGYEDFHLQLSMLSVSVAKDIYADDKSYSINVPGKKFIETIKWSEVDLPDDSFILKAYPVSSLPNDPSGRLQTVQEYVQAGFYTQRTAKRLLDFPDLEATDDLQTAEEDYLHKILEAMVEDGEYTPPDPYDNLELAQELSLEYIAQGKRDVVPEDKMEMLRLFNSQVQELKAKAEQATAPAPMAGGAQAAPMAPPVSDMLPNLPQ